MKTGRAIVYFWRVSGTLRLGLGQKIWMYCDWESHLVQKVELIKVPQIEVYMGINLKSLREIHWESYLVQMVDLR